MGLLAGMALEGEMDKVNEKRERKTLTEQLGHGPAGASAAALQGQAMRVWVDETIRDGRYVAGHFDARNLSAS